MNRAVLLSVITNLFLLACYAVSIAIGQPQIAFLMVAISLFSLSLVHAFKQPNVQALSDNVGV